MSNLAVVLIVPGLLWGGLAGIRFDKFLDIIKVKLRKKRIRGGMAIYLCILTKKILNLKSYDQEMKESQALIITLAIAVFVLIPRMKYLFPPDLQNEVIALSQFVHENKVYITLIVYVAYLAFSFILFQDFIDLFNYKGRQTFTAKFVLFLFDLAVVFFSIQYAIIMVLIFSILTYLGYLIMGIDFSILLGFFIFPAWIRNLLAYLLVLLLMFFPIRIKIPKS